MKTLYTVLIVVIVVLFSTLIGGLAYGLSGSTEVKTPVPTPANTNCVVSNWGECSKTCGGGIQKRNVITNQSGTGATCPPLEQACNTHPCSSSPTSVPPFTSVVKTTPASDWVWGDISALGRQDVACGDKSVLNQLVLTRPTPTQIQYKYTCLESSDIGTPIQKETELYVKPGFFSLDHHNVKCDEGTGLSQMKLVSAKDFKFQYKYACAPVPSLTKCVEKQTPANGWDIGSVIALDKHDIKCDKDQVISELRLTRPTDSQFQYNYKCCSRS